MQPDIDYTKIGRRIKTARIQQGLSQADLGALVNCSNNHISHVETGQTKVSLSMLLKLAHALNKSIDYFLMDTPYAKCDSLIDDEISKKLHQCDARTLVMVNTMLDVLLEQQLMYPTHEPH